MANFTPGPWVISNLTDIFTESRNGKEYDGHQIADCYVDYEDENDPGITIEEAQANARLIAAAPDMYDVLKAQCHHCHVYYGDGTCDEILAGCEIKKALAKAEGREE